MCYPILNLKEDQFSTDDLMTAAEIEEAKAAGDDPSWAIYQTAGEVGLNDHIIQGELSSYPNSGYFLTFDSQKTTQAEYLEKFEKAEGAFFGNGARSVALEFAVYS